MIYKIPIFKLSITSPEKIYSWWQRKVNNKIIISEVTEPLTINFNKYIFEENGLFWEKLFGPINSWKCKCGLYNGIFINNLIAGSICEKWNSELNDNRVRRYNLGFINLNTPFIHNWYFKGYGNILSTLLNLSNNKLEDLLYYKNFFKIKNILLQIKSQSFNQFNLLNNNLKDNKNEFTYSKLLIANEILYNKLKNLNLLIELNKCRNLLFNEKSSIKKFKLIKKARLLHLLFISKIRPEWIFLTKLPVLPPALRPFNKLEVGNNFIISPLNNYYRLIILRNNRLKRWVQLRQFTPVIFELIEKQMLQKTIDSLFGHFVNIKQNETERPLINLSSFLKGKFGYFRQNLLGKRVDFSGRSVIVSGPDLVIGKIGLPYELAFNLFKPILINIFTKNNKIYNYLNSINIIEYRTKILKQILQKIVKKNVILINRAPTLHKMNIQSFKPYLIEGEALKLFPLACSGFNADFDGDQMGIFIPLTKISQYEAKYKLNTEKNILSFENNKNFFKPSQNMILGLYYLTLGSSYFNNKNLYFINTDDILYSYFNNLIEINTFSWVKFKIILNYKIFYNFILTTPGKILIQNYINSSSIYKTSYEF
uniref:DNA-directed RNA polymerase subunit n=1 Tax=Nephromyces sp. ex Molgula occidentalis TaxID=2544991 RepID=A0A5C1H7H5_9APIC|nr:plastid-encoded DNA-directed RNA polymerase beta' [Nephromyces sp. ex Molgula occidentalis]